MSSTVFFVWFLFAFFWTVNALRKPTPPGRGLPPMWLPAMIISELAPIFLVARAIVAAYFLSTGVAELALGRLGLWLFILSEVGLLLVIHRAARASRALGYKASLSGFVKVWDSAPRSETVEYDVPYSEDLTLNIHSQVNTENAPTLIYLHPGSWMRGRPGRQARPLVHRLVQDGWVVLDIRYPLSPKATFPDHVVGLKRAISWAKGSGAAYGIDPARIVLSGGSAGAHLAAVAALTPELSSLQPGFEGTDVSVAGCLLFYGIFDLLNRNTTRHNWPFIQKYVMKSGPKDNPDLYRLGSPIDLVTTKAPPFHIVHGAFDSVVLTAESSYLAQALRGSGSSVLYTEVGAAQHGFDGVSGLRAKAIASFCADWLNMLVAK